MRRGRQREGPCRRRGFRTSVAAAVLALLVVLLAAVPAFAAAPVYKLFATDGFITLADGTQLYNYGFVGGRADDKAIIQLSSVMPPGWPAGTPFTPNGAAALVTWLNNKGATVRSILPYDPATGQAIGGPKNAMITIVTWADVNVTGGPPTTLAGVGAAGGWDQVLMGNAQFPAPIIYSAVGDVVEIQMKNLGVTAPKAPNDPHTIHLHGLDVDAANDGVPETSVAAVPANLLNTPGAGNVIVYMFSPVHPGTYMYHCHQEADIHVQMGMYGALVVYDPEDEAYLNGGPTTGGGTLFGWSYTKDVVMLLSDIDVRQHTAEQNAVGGGAAYNPVTYQPQYWFVNGLSFPNTIHAQTGPLAPFNWAIWNATHPGYDPLITGKVAGATEADKVLIRVINMGFQTHPMHMHGFHGKIIGSDQRAWPWANEAGVTPTGQGLEKNTLTIGSGETYEWLIDFNEQKLQSTYPSQASAPAAEYQGGTQTRFTPDLLPASNTSNAPAIPIPGFLIAPNTYIGGPTVAGLWGPDTVNGAVGATAPNTPAANGSGQVFVFHNHDDYKATNNGVYPGGMFTAIIPLPNP